MAALLAVALLTVLVHQVVGVLRPGTDRGGRPRWLAGGHALMAFAMMWMLLAPPSGTVATALVAGFAVGTVHAAGAALRARGTAAAGRAGVRARLAVGCAAMVAMLWPATAAAAPTGASGAEVVVAGGHHGTLLALTAGHAHQVVLTPGSPLLWACAVLLLGVVAVAVRSAAGAVAPGRTGSRAGTRGETRADLCCESVMSAAAAWMLAVPLLATLAG